MSTSSVASNPGRQETGEGRSVQAVDASGGSPEWASLVQERRSWSFVQGKLTHRDAQDTSQLAVEPAGRRGAIHRGLVNRFWAAQKNSSATRRAIARLLAALAPHEWGLNIGSGETSFQKNILNVDIYRSENIDVVNKGHELPFEDNTIGLIISQEVLEHVDSPTDHVREAHRVLRPGGAYYCQMPFIIGYHPGPHDYWRFSRESYRELLHEDLWEIEELDLSLGHGSGFYRVLVEFLAVNASLVSERLYLPTKGAASVLFAPLQWLDKLTKHSKQKDRIPGGYYCIARKKSKAAA